MTADEMREIFSSDEYRRDVEEMSSYLASIKQERPIIYSLAKYSFSTRTTRDLTWAAGAGDTRVSLGARTAAAAGGDRRGDFYG
jgi:hypothetical protein